MWCHCFVWTCYGTLWSISGSEASPRGIYYYTTLAPILFLRVHCNPGLRAGRHPLFTKKNTRLASPVVVPCNRGSTHSPRKKPENFRRTGSGVGFQKRDWQWGSQSMIPHKSESKPRRDSHSSSNFGPEKNGKVGPMSIAQI